MTDNVRPISRENRQCSLCLSVNTLSPSHRRNSHETFLAVVAPYMRPHRCSACNWRGMVGRFALARHRKLNILLNALLYIAFLALAVYVLIILRARLHPVSLLELEFVLPAYADNVLITPTPALT